MSVEAFHEKNQNLLGRAGASGPVVRLKVYDVKMLHVKFQVNWSSGFAPQGQKVKNDHISLAVWGETARPIYLKFYVEHFLSYTFGQTTGPLAPAFPNKF